MTRAAGPENIALQAQYVGLLGQVEDQVLDCFHHGGGVPYEGDVLNPYYIATK